MLPIAKLSKKVIWSNFSELRAPYKLIYAVTYRCQLRCGMCSIGSSPPIQELALDEISEFFRRGHGFSWINLSGGEIFLRQDLLEVIRVIGQYCRDVYLLNFPTNGYETDLIADIVAEIVRSRRFPKVMVTISLDGPPDLHDRIRNRPGSWDRAVDTFSRLRQLRSRHFSVSLGMTLQDANADAYEETVISVRDRVRDVSHGDFHVNIMHMSDHYYGNTECGGIRNTSGVLSALDLVRSRRGASIFSPVGFLEKRYQDIAANYLKTGNTPFPCQALSASLFMAPDGTVYPCTIYNAAIGNIRNVEYDLARLWNSGTRSSIREAIMLGECPRCWTPCEAYQSIMANVFTGAAR